MSNQRIQNTSGHVTNERPRNPEQKITKSRGPLQESRNSSGRRRCAQRVQTPAEALRPSTSEKHNIYCTSCSDRRTDWFVFCTALRRRLACGALTRELVLASCQVSIRNGAVVLLKNRETRTNLFRNLRRFKVEPLCLRCCPISFCSLPDVSCL